MSIACPRTHRWLHSTFRSLIIPSRRPVSTTSAIKRGLRAENATPQHRGRRKDWSRGQESSGETLRVERKQSAGAKETALHGIVRAQHPAVRLKKFTSQDGPDATFDPAAPVRKKEKRIKRPTVTTQEDGALMREKSEATKYGMQSNGRRDRKGVRPAVLSQQNEEGEGRKGDESSSRHQSAQVYERKAKPSEGDEDTAISVRYTVAASAFLYGYNTVLAALQANRRKFYHLYLSDRVVSREKNATIIQSLAKEYRIRTSLIANPKLLDKMSNQRPHNGVVLEASMVPAPPVLALGEPNEKSGVVPLELQGQTAEDVIVNGAPTALPSLMHSWRHPFVLMLDGIKDEGNMGNIIRTAHFYGVDAVAIATNTCASINSSILAKASSGAVEAVRILALPSPASFVYKSAKAKWKIYGAVPPPPPAGSLPLHKYAKSNALSKYITATSVAGDSPLAKDPCILMLGAEDEGLRDNLKNKADHFVSIAQGERGANSPLVGVDSVNVSVAAGVLLQSFMRRPEDAPNGSGKTNGPALGF